MKKQSKSNERPDFAEKIGLIYNEVNSIEIKPTDTHESSLNKFYKIMRKHGIKHGTWSEDGIGVISANPEWVMLYDVFKNKIDTYYIFANLLQNPPKDLLAYGKKTIIKPEKSIKNKK